MKLSISNIAWSVEHDDEMYEFLYKNGFLGLEIAPTRIFPTTPYDCLDEAVSYAECLKANYALTISSMQSIWFGIADSIFGTDDDRQKLIDYTKKAIDFANSVGCANLVFGCPKNRNIPDTLDMAACLPIAYGFFAQIANYASEHGVCVAIEPNPPIYNTNFINTTTEAFEICRKLNNPGIKVNFDLGTMLHYGEDVSILKENIDLITHVHISEPGLVPIEKREFHKEFFNDLKEAGYKKFLSIEMGNKNNIELVKETILYVKELYEDV